MQKSYRYINNKTGEPVTFVNPQRKLEKDLMQRHGLTNRKQLQKLLKDLRRKENAIKSDTI